MGRVLRLLVASAVLALAAGSIGFAQSMTTASITGRISDSSGGVIANAGVTIRSLEHNRERATTTTNQGEFRFLSLPVGSYEIVASASGFQTASLTLALAVGDAIEVPIVLAVAAVTTRIDVSAEAPIVESRRTQSSGGITPRQIDELPLNGRNYLDLALLTPGVSRTVLRNTERFAETSAVPGTGISVAGQRNLNNTFIVDGVSANDDAAGLAGTYFAEDVIREFQVVTSGGIAEFGRSSAGIVNVVTRSGANERHGRVYGFFRNDALDARNPLATREDPLDQEQFGVTLSGPIARDRTFWFANAERTDFDRTGIVTVSTASIDAINRVLDRTGYGGTRVATGEFPTGYETLNLFGRVDHWLSTASRLALRYSLYDVASENARSVGGLNTTSRATHLDDRDQTVAVNWLTTRDDAAVNELRAQATRSRLSAPAADPVGPAVNISGVASFGTSTTSPTGRDLDVFELSDSHTVQRGAHLLKAGASFLYNRLDIEFPGALQGVYSFSSLANFQAGRYTSYQQAFGEPHQFQSNQNIGVFVQDEWRPRHDLTINGGLRYDVQWIEDLVETDADNLSPRFGVAFAPGGGRTVLRAAGGLYFDRIPLRAVSNALQRDGVKYRVALVQPGQKGAPAFPEVMPAFPEGILTGITTIDRGIQSGVGRQASVQVERQLGTRISATLGYLHLTGRHIIMSRNINVPTLTAAQAALAGDPNLGRPDPTVANNGQFQGIGQSQYNGLTAAIDVRYGRWGAHRASYTLSKALDDAGNAFFSSPQDNFNVHDDWGRSDNDQRHRFVASGTVPGAWGMEFAYLAGYASAPPFNIQTGNDRNNDTNANDRPVGVGRNTGEGFDSATLDLRASRSFAVAAGTRIEILVDAFNVLNRSNFLIPNNTFGTGTTPPPSFGQPTAAADPRQIQIGLRWTF